MAEVSKDAMALISISWQALNRLSRENPDTELCDCTVVLLFASIFIEANLNYIIEYINMTQQMRQFLNHKHPGLQNKLGWFYNEYVARDKSINRKDKRFEYKVIRRKLGRKFPGYCKLTDFRNEISHGYIVPSIANPTEVMKLRQQAKDIVEELFVITMKNGYDIPRTTTYLDVIGSSKTKMESNAPTHFIHITSSS